MQRIPISRASQLYPFIAFLKDIGTPVERHLERHKLPLGLLENPNMFVMTRATYDFVEDMAEREGIDGFGWRIANPSLTQKLSQKIASAPTLFEAIKGVCLFAKKESTGLNIWIEEHGDTLYFNSRGSRMGALRGADEFAMYRGKIMLSIIRQFIEPDWTPDEWCFEIKCEMPDLVQESLNGKQTSVSSERGSLPIPRSLLANRFKTPLLKTTPSGNGDTVPDMGLAGTLKYLLKTYPPSSCPSFQEGSYLSGGSARSLQRRLKEEGTSFRAIVMQVKYDQACDLLQQLDLQIIEVAFRLGFQSPAHFTRFFRNISGQTPSEYRTTLPSRNG